MAFKIQDLMNDLSTEVACTKVTGPPRLLAVLFCTKTSGVCTGHVSVTTGLTVTVTVTMAATMWMCLHFLDRKPDNSAEQIALLKAQLKEALTEIEREEKSMAEPFEPKTVEEAEKLQDKLRKALDHLEQEKLKLSKK